MAVTASAVDPWFVNTALQSNEARFALAALVGRSPSDLIAAETGVLPSGDAAFQPTSNGTSTAPKVSVDRGFCVVQTAAGGTYICTWPTAQPVSLTAPASNPRIDTLCARVRDTDVDSSGVKLFELITVDGTPAASPVAPAIPSGYLPLYDIRVGSTAQSGALTITDRRTYTRGAGGIRYCPDWDLGRNGSYPGDLRVRANGAIDAWLGSSWITVASPSVWTQFTPVLYTQNSGAQNLGTGGSAIGRYLIVGKVMHLRYIFRGGTGTAYGWGDVYTQLPPGIVAAPSEETQILAKLNAHWPVGTLYAIWNGLCFINSSTNRMSLWFPVSSSRSDLTTYRISGDAAGTAGTGFPQVPAGFPTPGILVIQGTVEIT